MATQNSPNENCSGFVDNWQAGKTLAECNLRMLEREDSCDVTFRCGTNGHVMKAHRYVLISRSCVFHAMFSGPLAEISDVNVPEIKSVFFKELLVYLYTENVTVDSNNATALLYAARKYAVSGLENKCIDFLETNLSVENACVILEASHRFDQEELFEKALALIKRDGERSLQSPGFLALSQVLVNQIVESDDLTADEHVIFTAINNWAESECVRQGRGVTPDGKRSALGETLFKVRFTLMKQSFLVENVKVSGLLTDKEHLMILEYMISPVGSIHPSNNGVRLPSRQTVIHTTSKQRFKTTAANTFWAVSGGIDAISFKSNNDLVIHGCQLYGQYSSTTEAEYKVTSYFGNEETVLNTVVQDGKLYTAGNEPFDVKFPVPVSIIAGTWYTLAVRIAGPCTWCGENGMTSVTCDDWVQFNFRNSNKSRNGTKTINGQIPALIYSIL